MITKKLTIVITGAILSAIILLAVGVGLVCCRKTTVADVAGEYVGHYGGATERLILRPDGTLWQELRKGTDLIYTNEGTWEISTGTSDLKFVHFYVAADKNTGQEAKLAADVKIAPWLAALAMVFKNAPDFQLYTDFRSITTAPDTAYFFDRVATPAAGAAKK